MQSHKQNTPILQIDPKVLLTYLVRYWYLMVIGLASGLSYAYYQVRYTPSSYSATSRMLVKDEHSSWGQEYFLPGMELVSGRNRLVNEIGIIRSLPLMRRVADKLNIPFFYFKVGNIKTTEMYPRTEFSVRMLNGKEESVSYFIDFPNKGFYRYHIDDEKLKEVPQHPLSEALVSGQCSYEISVQSDAVYEGSVYKFSSNSNGALARYLQGSIQINVENQESSILVLTDQGPTPEKSIDYLNALMKEYIQWGKDQNNEITTNTIAFVDQQLSEINDSLSVTERRLEQFQKRNFEDRIFVQDESSNMNLVFELEETLTQRSVQKEYYTALIKTLKQEEFTAFPSAAVFGFQDPNVDRMIGLLVAAVGEKRERAFANKVENIVLQRVESEVKSVRNDLLDVAAANRLQVMGLIDSLTRHIEQEELKVLRIPKEQREYFKLLRENKLLTDLYTFLLNKRSEASIAKASNVAKAQILDFADSYRVTFVGPKGTSIFTSAIFIGVAIPLTIILLIYVSNTKVVDLTDLNRLTNIPVLGSILHQKDMDNNIIVSNSLKSVMAEAFRNLRTKLNYMSVGNSCTKVLVTSSISGEGKTFTSINLAAIYAAAGKKTVLLGADLRKPKIFQDFKLSNEVGLSTYLIRKVSLEEVVQATNLENLDLISSGPIPPNPAELIESEVMEDLFQELESKYEVIIIDSPPLGLVTDALLLKKYANAAIYIVRHNYTKKGYLENVNQLYENKILTNIGIVVNAVKQKSSIGYGNSYGYGYGYGYGYYSEDNN
jgi:tyrosine-protein kinase Etk/Wzc